MPASHSASSKPQINRWDEPMAATMQSACRVEYRGRDIVITGPAESARREAQRIIQRFACSAAPYRLARVEADQVILQPA